MEPPEFSVPHIDEADLISTEVWLQTVEEHVDRALEFYSQTFSTADRLDEAFDYLKYLADQNAIDPRMQFDIFHAFQQKYGGG